MIFDAILSFFYFMVWGIVWLLPDALVFPQSFHHATQYFGDKLFFWNVILPVTELFFVLYWSFGIALTIIGLKVAFWIISVIRGNSSPVK